MSKLEDKYGLLPAVSESVVEKAMSEVSEFVSFMKHDPEGARRSVEHDIEWLKENKDFLGNAVKAAIDSALDLYSDKLTHKDWIELRTYLLKGVLLLLQMINESMRET